MSTLNINQAKKLILDELHRRNINDKIYIGILAQFILESGVDSDGNFKSSLAKNHHNYTGMKWTSKCGTKYVEYKTAEQKPTGEYYNIVARFRSFNTPEEGVKGMVDFLTAYSRYKPALASQSTEEYCNRIRECGWATSLKYTQNLLNVVKKYHLEEEKEFENSKDVIKVLQQALNGILIKETPLVVDGICGPKTKAALLKVFEYLCG